MNHVAGASSDMKGFWWNKSDLLKQSFRVFRRECAPSSALVRRPARSGCLSLFLPGASSQHSPSVPVRTSHFDRKGVLNA
jgi:hypothetical protein